MFQTLEAAAVECGIEFLAACERGGVDRRLAVESLSNAFGRIAGSKTQQLLDRDSEPRFTLNALLKDLFLARDAAQLVQTTMPILECVLPRIQAAASSGLGERDYIAIALQPHSETGAQRVPA